MLVLSTYLTTSKASAAGRLTWLPLKEAKLTIDSYVMYRFVFCEKWHFSAVHLSFTQLVISIKYDGEKAPVTRGVSKAKTLGAFLNADIETQPTWR